MVPFAALWGLLREAGTRVGLIAGGGDAPAAALKSVAAAAAALAVAGGAVTTTGSHGGDRTSDAAPAHLVAATASRPATVARTIVLPAAHRPRTAATHVSTATPVVARIAAPAQGSEGGVTAHVPVVPQHTSAPAPAQTAGPAPTTAPATSPPAASAAEPVRHTVEQVRQTLQRTVDGVQRAVAAVTAPVQPVVDIVRRTVDGLLTPAR
jgi:hypothetical protein